MVIVAMLTLITGNLLVIKPPPSVYRMSVQYHPSNTPDMSAEPEDRWYPMENKPYYGHHIATANITADEMFLFTRYRMFFKNRTQLDTFWDLYLWNQKRLSEYFYTPTALICTASFVCISLIVGIIVYVVRFK